MSEVIEHPDAGNGDGVVEAVRVGDNLSPVTLKTYQDIYHQVTGRTEQIRKRYSENLLVEFGEIEQLNHKILQLCDVHKVVASNETVSVFHEKERKEQFTSFERFRGYNANASSPTVSVVLRYNFSIIPAGVRRPQEYVVNVRLISRLAALQQAQEEAPPFLQGRLFGFMAGPTAEVTVDYADYVVARGFLEAVDEWVAGCKTTPNSKVLRLLQRHSHHFAEVAQIFVAGAVTYFAYQAVPNFVATGTSPTSWARFAVIYVGGAFILIRLARRFGRSIEMAIDTFPVLSYLKLNRGDEKIISAAGGAKPWAWFQLALSAIGSIVLGVISSKLERLI